jgi:hypothetical protein
METNQVRCESAHQLLGCYEALAEMSVAYLKNSNDERREFFANHLEERIEQLKQDLTQGSQTHIDSGGRMRL